MPAATCFNYGTGVQLSIRKRSTGQWAPRNPAGRPGDVGPCFSYSAGVLLRRPGGPTGHGSSCFSYSAGMPLADRPRMLPGEGSPCFSYSAGGPLGDLPRMPGGVCFNY